MTIPGEAERRIQRRQKLGIVQCALCWQEGRITVKLIPAARGITVSELGKAPLTSQQKVAIVI